MKWSAYIVLAESITPPGRAAKPPKALQTDDELARARSVISRAYYAAFHVGEAYVVSKGWWTPRSAKHHIEHGEVWQLLMGTRARPTTEDESDAGSKGDSLMEARRKADYRTWNIDELQEWVDDAATEAREICRLLNHKV